MKKIKAFFCYWYDLFAGIKILLWSLQETRTLVRIQDSKIVTLANEVKRYTNSVIANSTRLAIRKMPGYSDKTLQVHIVIRTEEFKDMIYSEDFIRNIASELAYEIQEKIRRKSYDDFEKIITNVEKQL